MSKETDVLSALKAYIDDVLAKTKATRLVQVGRTVPVPGPMPEHPEYVKIAFLEEVPMTKTRMDFARELESELNVLIGEAKGAYVQKPSDTSPAPAALPASSPPPTPKPDLETLLNKLEWSQPNEKGYQWTIRIEAETIPEVKAFIEGMKEKWNRLGEYSYILTGDDFTLLGRMPIRRPAK